MHTSFFSSILSPYLLHFSCTYSCVLPWYLTLLCTQLISINWYSKVCVLNICAPAKPSILDNALCLDMEHHVCPLVNKGKPQTKGNAARSGLSFWNQLYFISILIMYCGRQPCHTSCDLLMCPLCLGYLLVFSANEVFGPELSLA